VYDTILFDFFGVIFADPLKAWAAERGYAVDGIIAETARLLDTGAISYREYVARLADFGGEATSVLARRFQSSTLLNNAIVDTITRLGEKHRIGLLSNTCTEEITPLLEQHQLRNLFHTIVISSETGFAKPDPAIFSIALERMSADPEKTIFIDDSATNIAAASALGMQTICFTDTAQLRSNLARHGIAV
jgi:putative hydrolase of the HAD superfamily